MTSARVFVVDDEPMVRTALARLLSAAGFAVEVFASGPDFLSRVEPNRPGCALLDLAMPEMDGLALQGRLSEMGAVLGIVFLTGHGDIPASVQAMRSGAIDFLTKPVRRGPLLAAVRAALEQSEARSHESMVLAELKRKHQRLTPREREVLTHLIAGKLNKVIAADLGTTEQTIKVHRRRVMRKMSISSVAELVWIAHWLDIKPAL